MNGSPNRGGVPAAPIVWLCLIHRADFAAAFNYTGPARVLDSDTWKFLTARPITPARTSNRPVEGRMSRYAKAIISAWGQGISVIVRLPAGHSAPHSNIAAHQGV